MKRVELYGRVRHAVMIEGLSQREAARCFGIDPRTVRKMLSYSVPPGYVRTRPPVRPKLDPFIGIIDRILEEDKDRPKKQRHTSKRIFERLRDEYGFTGKIAIVKDYICGVRQRRREMFVPLTHPPGHAQVDFGEALAVIGGVERKIHFLAMSLPHSDAYICGVRQRRREMFVPLTHGHAQVDFGEARFGFASLAVIGAQRGRRIGGVEIHFLAMSLPHSDACFVKAYPGEGIVRLTGSDL